MQCFGEVKRIFVHPSGRRADVVYADIHGVTRVACLSSPSACVDRGVSEAREPRGKRVRGIDTALRASSSRTSSYTRAGQGHDDGAIFVSSFRSDMTQEELSEALAPFGKYERLVMRMFFLPSSFPRAIGFSDRDL